MKHLNSISHKFSLLLFALLLFAATAVNAQWTYLGDTLLPVSPYTMTMDVWQGTPYMAYDDEAVQGKGTVIRYDGANWGAVGIPGFTPDKASDFSLKMNDSIPYVAFIDRSFEVGNEKGKLTVMKYESGTWTYVGTTGFSPGILLWDKPVLTISGGTPYVAFRANNNVWVMQFDGNNWVQVGPPIATYARDLSLIVHDETPYIAYQTGNTHRSTVKKFDGTDWVNVGDTNFDGHAYSTMSFAISESGTPYLTHDNVNPGEYGGIIKFDGNEWVNIAPPNITPSILTYKPIAFDGEIPYIAIQHPNLKLTVMRYKDASWEMVGSTITVADGGEFSADFVTIVIENGVPYLGFRHFPFAGVYPATIMKFTEISSSNDLLSKTDFRLYPNPSRGGEVTFYLENAGSDDALLQVFNLDGKQFFEQKITLEVGKTAYSVRLPDLSAGIYLTKLVTSGGQIASSKLVIMD